MMTAMETDATTGGLGLPRMPKIDGIGVRHWRDTTDFEPMAAVMTAAARTDGVPWLPTADILRVEIEGNPNIDPTRDMVLVDVDSRIVAVAGTNRVIRDGVPVYETWGDVHPDVRRRGIGSALLDWNVARSRERAAALDPGADVIVQTHAEQGQAGAVALSESRGFEVIRRFYLMRRDLRAPIPDAPLPEGLEVRPVTPDQHRVIYDAQAEAFQDHWGAREPTEHGFEVTYGRKEIDTSMWVVAWDGDQIAGVVENWIWPEENAALGVERGWLEKISVRRPWRRRGLARALVLRSLGVLRDRGLAEGMLGVDATNPTGAMGLYEGTGFEIDRREFVYRRVFPA